MQKRTKLEQQLLIAGCVGAMLATTGCRSAMPKWNLFSWRSTPSAETLAGNGPTITYPAPPSETATPDAIASVAGGTAGSQATTRIAASTPKTGTSTAGFDAAKASADAMASRANPAAAQANGFSLASAGPSGIASAPDYAGSAASSSGKNSSVPAIPAGYQFGTQASSSGSSPAGTSRYAMPSSYPAPGTAPGVERSIADTPSGYSLPTGIGASATMPPSSTGSNSFEMPQGNVAATSRPASGFAMPDSMPPAQATAADAAGLASSATNALPFTPKTATTSGIKLPSSGPSSTPATAVSTGASAPSFSTASAALIPRSSEAMSSGASQGYAPGSTSGAGSYPTTSGYPSTGTEGSFYR